MINAMLKDSIKIQSKVSEIRKTSSRIIAAAKACKADEDILFDIKLSIEEALRNAMHHGNKNKENLEVDVAFAVDDKALEVVIEDRGEGFDYKNMPDPTAEENILKAGGRGLYLIFKLMDEVHFNDRGNKICMVKYLRREK